MSSSQPMRYGMPMLKRGEACKECRRRKLRCDGEKPVCTICVKANRECTYERPVTRPVYEILQERLAFLEERFQALSEEASLPSSAPPPASAPSAPQVEPSITNPSHTQAATTEPTPSPFDTMAISLSRVSYDLTDVKWYEAETLAAPQRNFMLNIFLQYHESLHFYFHIPTFVKRLNSSHPADRPHPAFIESMCLMACYFVSRGFVGPSHPLALEIQTEVALPRMAELPQLEEHFLRRARQALVDSLSYSDRLMDFLRGSVLVTLYLYMRGRYLEGYHVHCGAARLALSCGLHRLESQVLRDDSSGRLPSTGPPGVVLLNPPQNQIELADRITTFWMIYLCDKMSSVCAGFVGALPDEGSTVDAIRTVFPRRIAEYEADAVTESYNGTLHDLFNATAVPASELLPDLPWTATLKGLSLLDRATRLGATLQLEPTEETVLAIRRLEFATLGQRSTLPAFDSFVTPTSSALSMSYHDLGMFIGHTSSIGALLEIYQTLVDIDENAYGARLKCAVDIAKLARVAKDGGLVNGCLISAGYCWSLAARVLVQHIESNYATEPYTINYESHLADVVTALELLSITFPALLYQFGQVQNALGRVRGLGSIFVGQEQC